MEERKLLKRKEKAENENNKLQLALVCNNLGDFYNNQGNYEAAVKEYEQEARIYSKITSKQLELAKANRMIAEMQMLLTNFEAALKHVNIYLKIVRNLNNRIEEQRALASLGRVHLLHGQSASDNSSTMRPLKNAEKAFIESLLICKELPGDIDKVELLDMQARLFLNLGVVREHLEDFKESINYMEKAIKISKTNDLYELLHLCYVSASLLYHYKINDSTLALRFCNLALEVAERLPNRAKKECETLIIKAEIMIKESDFQSAKQVLHKAYKLMSPDQNDRNTIEKTLRVVAALCYTLDTLVTVSLVDYKTKRQLYEKMGDGCCILQNYSKAIDYYEKMLDCAERNNESGKDLIPIYVSLYQTYKDDKKYDKALEYLWKEFDFQKDEPVEAFYTLCNIGEVCELQTKPFWTIQSVYQKAIDEAKRAENKQLERIGLTRLMKIQQKFNMHNLAEDLKEEAKTNGMDLTDESDDEQNVDQNTPDIGDEICLEDLTDSEGELQEQEKPRATRKRGICLTIKRNNKGETQLHQACIAGNLELARRLIEQGHTVNVRDHAGWLPLHEACNHGHKEVVELLLDKGAISAINDKGGTSCDGITPLYDACSNGYLGVVELLLDRGANCTLKTDFGDTPLNILEKWRSTADLDIFETAQYDTVRAKLLDKLKITGTVKQSPNTSANSSRTVLDDESLQKLRRYAYDSSSDEEISAVPSTSNALDQNLAIVEQFNVLREFNGSNNSEMNKSNKSSNVRQEYKNVMESLKRPNRPLISSVPEDRIVRKRPGFLEADEIDDDWLDDDMKPYTKKQKFLTDRAIYSAGDHEDRPKPGLSPRKFISLPEKSPKENLKGILDQDSGSEDSRDAFHLLLTSKQKSKEPKKSRMPRMSSSTSGGMKKRKQQSSLLDNGFCRFKSTDCLSMDDSNEPSTEPDSTTTNSEATADTVIPHSLNKSVEEVLPVPMPIVSFKIKIDQEMLLVPVDRKKINETNIRWLAEEASRRYYNMVGLRPILRLLTADGFAFEETDLISVAINETMIIAKVLEWKQSPLSQRYEDICNQLSLALDLNVKDALEKSEITNSLFLNDFGLTPDLSQPVISSLMHQSMLTVLDLSNNFIQDEGCKQLAKSLSTLQQLRVLNLMGNNITDDGLKQLILPSVNRSNSTLLPAVEELVFSFNPLGNQSVRNLELLCKQAPNLIKLSICSCDLTNFYNFDLSFHNLTQFDVSFNLLSMEAFRNLGKKLNSCRLQALNLGFTTTESVKIGGLINELLESGTCEKFNSIDLSGCHLIDSDVYSIVENLSKAKGLEFLNLSGNQKLTALSFQYILNRIPQTKKIFMEQCPDVMNASRLGEIHLNLSEDNPELIVFSAVANDIENDYVIDTLRSIWDSRRRTCGKVEIRGHKLLLYVNESDLL